VIQTANAVTTQCKSIRSIEQSPRTATDYKAEKPHRATHQ
jgi:hypothetical protein